jgi:hypothetical protein
VLGLKSQSNVESFLLTNPTFDISENNNLQFFSPSDVFLLIQLKGVNRPSPSSVLFSQKYAFSADGGAFL